MNSSSSTLTSTRSTHKANRKSAVLLASLLLCCFKTMYDFSSFLIQTETLNENEEVFQKHLQTIKSEKEGNEKEYADELISFLKLPTEESKAQLNLLRDKSIQFNIVVHRGTDGLGHRLIRQSNAYHLLKTFNFNYLKSQWGWVCLPSQLDIFDYLFREGPLIIPPKSSTPIFSWKRPFPLPKFNKSISKDRRIKFVNDVTNYFSVPEDASSIKYHGKILKKKSFYQKPISDVEFYTQLRTLFQFNIEAQSFLQEYNFSDHTVFGIHIRAGNNEKGHFKKNKRGILDEDQWLLNVGKSLAELTVKYCLFSNFTKPPLIFVATDTPSMIKRLKRSMKPYNIPVVTFPQKRVKEGLGVSYKNFQGNNSKCFNGWKSQFLDMTLLSLSHVVIAGQYSSFTQSMPLSIVLGNTTINLTETSKTWFCEVGEKGDVIQCFNNYVEWIRRESSLPLIGNTSSPLQKFKLLLHFPKKAKPPIIERIYAAHNLSQAISTASDISQVIDKKSKKHEKKKNVEVAALEISPRNKNFPIKSKKHERKENAAAAARKISSGNKKNPKKSKKHERKENDASPSYKKDPKKSEKHERKENDVSPPGDKKLPKKAKK